MDGRRMGAHLNGCDAVRTGPVSSNAAGDSWVGNARVVGWGLHVERWARFWMNWWPTRKQWAQEDGPGFRKPKTMVGHFLLIYYLY